MPVNELSVVNCIVNSAADWGLTDALRSAIADRVRLDDAEWTEQFIADGFSDADVARLDDLIAG